MTRMPLDLLNTFVTFVREGNVSVAAASLRLSQPAVSTQLKRLEELAPFPLFAMQGKRKVLTHFGRALHDAVAARIEETHRAVEEVSRRYLEPGGMRLRIGARKEVIARVGASLRYEGPIEFVDLGSDAALRALERFEIDVAIVQRRETAGHLVSKKLFSDAPRFVVPKPLCARAPTLRELGSRAFLGAHPCVAYKPDLPYLSAWCEHHGVPATLLRVRRTCDDWPTVVRMVEAGLGFAIAPTSVPVEAACAWTVPVPEGILAPSTFHVLFHADLKSVPAVQELLAAATSKESP